MDKTYHFDPIDREQVRMLRQLTPGQRIRRLLDARELAVGLHRGRLRRRYRDLSPREINLKVLEEIARALPEDVFRFKNYRLIGETVMTGIEWSEVSQGVVADRERYMIEGMIGEIRSTDDSGTVKLQVSLHSTRFGPIFTTGVNARIGQLLVLGSAQPDPERGALILAVRAELDRP